MGDIIQICKVDGLRNPKQPLSQILIFLRGPTRIPHYSSRLLPWIQSGKTVLGLQGYAIRAQHKSKKLHKNSGLSDTSSSKSKDPSCCLSGRLDSLGTNSGGMPSVSQEGDCSSAGPRLPSQREKISPVSGIEVRLAGPVVGLRVTHSFPSSGQEEIDSQTVETISQTSSSIKESSGESSGLSSSRL